MRASKLLMPTVKEVPAEAEIPSHRLMIRSGMIRKLASGTYTYLPLGQRCLLRICRIIREEMDAAGAQEIVMPALQPIELWQATGRDADYGETMCRFTDRHGRQNVLAPTAEEVVTALAAAELKSYKQLPVNLYQIGPKFRDEFRPRFGVLRSREFLMKDAYSFHATLEGLAETYRVMYETYERIFRRCGLPYVVVRAETGEMGGAGSHQFTTPCETGEDVIVHTADGSYAANIERADVDPPQEDPDLEKARSQVPAPEPVHTPGATTIEQVTDFLKCHPSELIKTLIYQRGEDVVVGLVRGDHELNAEKFTHAAGGGHLEMAPAAVVEELTGAAVGFAGPMGMAEKVAHLVVDPYVAAMVSGTSGANKTDYHVRNIVPGREFPLEGENVTIADIRNAAEGDTYEGRPLAFARGIEVGQVFQLGNKYSKSLGANVLDESGQERTLLMGCYGIGVNRVLAAAIEAHNDENGPILPVSIAPFDVEVLPLNADDEQVQAEAQRIYDALTEAGQEVLLDDRPMRPGAKFKDADLIGIPLRVVIGGRGLKGGTVELKRRTDEKPTDVPVAEAVEKTLAALDEMRAALDPDEEVETGCPERR